MSARRVGDRFVVGDVLGSGGMSSIHRGTDERLGEEVAIKFLRQSLTSDPVVRERFRREATALAKLRHPGIVSVLDFGEADGELYLVLELLRGRTLEERLFEGALAPVAAAPIFDQLLAALELCHEAGVVHRDIKPSNVMLTGPERVTLIDFGLARIETQEDTKLTETGTVHGTPSYMAPEQCRGHEVGPPADVYAVGVMLYEALSGAPPFGGDNAAVLMAQHLFAPPAPLPLLPRGLEAAILHALQKKPEDRPTARALRHELTSAFKGTDAATLAEEAAKQRVHMAGLPRSERALTGRPPAAKTEPMLAAPAATVGLWMSASNRSAELRGALGTAGFVVVLADGDEPPIADVVLASAKDGFERLRALGKRAFVLVDVGGPAETTRAIRAGAADMLLTSAPDADVVPKLQKVLRRVRRG
ncbi:MAG: serine/threonine protein kinase [Labilithrix sp.]|nr:serine/threonine protein kinase [Labilithrix sp.]MCW5815629.1 serine/threonine protein kinase [Labilithrix sp.]